jgi:hypothetical protein
MRGTPVGSRATETATILGGSSGCCLLRADHVRALGGPEPMFFAYLEDVDLALRLRYAGYQTVFVQDAVRLPRGLRLRPARVRLSRCSSLRATADCCSGSTGRGRCARRPGERSWTPLTPMYSTLGTPIAPWAGRLEALRFRRYTAFLRRARRRSEPLRAEFDRPPRASLMTTLRRKRRVIADDS